MLNTPTDLHRGQECIRDATQLLERVGTRLTQSKTLIQRGKARTVACPTKRAFDRRLEVFWLQTVVGLLTEKPPQCLAHGPGQRGGRRRDGLPSSVPLHGGWGEAITCGKSRAVDGRTSALRMVCIKWRAFAFSRTVCEATQSAGMMSLYPRI